MKNLYFYHTIFSIYLIFNYTICNIKNVLYEKNIVPPSIPVNATRETEALFRGAIALTAPMMIPIAAKFANPQRAYVAITVDRSCKPNVDSKLVLLDKKLASIVHVLDQVH